MFQVCEELVWTLLPSNFDFLFQKNLYVRINFQANSDFIHFI